MPSPPPGPRRRCIISRRTSAVPLQSPDFQEPGTHAPVSAEAAQRVKNPVKHGRGPMVCCQRFGSLLGLWRHVLAQELQARRVSCWKSAERLRKEVPQILAWPRAQPGVPASRCEVGAKGRDGLHPAAGWGRRSCGAQKDPACGLEASNHLAVRCDMRLQSSVRLAWIRRRHLFWNAYTLALVPNVDGHDVGLIGPTEPDLPGDSSHGDADRLLRPAIDPTGCPIRDFLARVDIEKKGAPTDGSGLQLLHLMRACPLGRTQVQGQIQSAIPEL